MLVVFSDASRTPVPESVRAAYEKVVVNALDLLRPVGEQWTVTLAVESQATLRLDFTRGTDAPRSITVASDGDDDRHSQVFRSVCRFVWAYRSDGRGTVQIMPQARH